MYEYMRILHVQSDASTQHVVKPHIEAYIFYHSECLHTCTIVC